MRRLVVVGVALAALALASPRAAAYHDNDTSDEVPAAQDNGGEGRSIPFIGGGDPPPRVACADVASPSGSLVIRVLPRGPLRPDGGFAFTTGVCIYLPPGYATEALRYPVLYLLHGGGGDHGDWVSQGGVQAIADAFYAADPRNALIVVMPDGTDAQWFDRLNGTLLGERYVIDYLIPYVDKHFRTIPGGSARAIGGLSNGGYGTMHFSAKHPDLFSTAGSMSGNLGGRSFDWGTGTSHPGYPAANTPAVLAQNLDHIDLILDMGAECHPDGDLFVDLCGTWAFEQLFYPDHLYFDSRIAEVAHAGDYDRRYTEGGHAWRWWSLWLRERHLPWHLERLADPVLDGSPVPASAPPSPFRFRSAFADFTAWGYRFEVDRRAGGEHVYEMLDATRVSVEGMTLTGSGSVRVTTAPVYVPGTDYEISGAGDAPTVATAGATGRLAFDVDLGDAHRYEHDSLEWRVLSQTPGYMQTRTVSIG